MLSRLVHFSRLIALPTTVLTALAFGCGEEDSNDTAATQEPGSEAAAGQPGEMTPAADNDGAPGEGTNQDTADDPAGDSMAGNDTPGDTAGDDSAGGATAGEDGNTSTGGQVGDGKPDQDPPTSDTSCGPNTCSGGDVCCNRSCGICAPPDAACTQQICEPQEDRSGGACNSAADCRLVDDYCGGCNCLSLTEDEQPPRCQDPVQCLIAPCENRVAVCSNGRCASTSNLE